MAIPQRWILRIQALYLSGRRREAALVSPAIAVLRCRYERSGQRAVDVGAVAEVSSSGSVRTGRHGFTAAMPSRWPTSA